MVPRASVVAALVVGCAHEPPPAAPTPSPARAVAAKPIAAVLGLEPQAGADATAARALTASLRARTAAPTSPFRLATGRAGDVELDERKDIGTCANEAAACMAAIGADLDVDLLIYGHVRHAADGDKLDVHLMDVRAHVNRRTATTAIAGDPAAAIASVFAQLADGVIAEIGREARHE